MIVIGVGVAQFLKGHKDKFEKRFVWSHDVREKLAPVCTFGLYIRGFIFGIIGCFIVYAAITTNPENTGGLSEALNWLRSQPFGPWLLGIVALGLAAFGVYSIVEAIYRKVDI